MIRLLAAAAAVAVLALPAAASAQTWGQPVYLNAYGRPVGGTPLSGVEIRPYLQTGRWADGYSDRPRVVVPAPGYGVPHPDYNPDYGRAAQEHRYAYGRGRGRYDQGHSHNPPRSRHNRPARPGYRDAWGYDDDRPPSGRGGSVGRRHVGDCGCGDVYLYDR